MLSAKLLTRLAGTAVAMVSAVTIAAAGGAFAAAPASAATTHHTAAHHIAATHTPRGRHTRPEAPSGCNSNNFCSYNQGNGGSLCFQTSSEVYQWSNACYKHNDSAYNRNGNSVNLFYCTGYHCAYATLYSGNYWLYMNQNKFTTCSNNCDGLNAEMMNQVASNQFN